MAGARAQAVIALEGPACGGRPGILVATLEFLDQFGFGIKAPGVKVGLEILQARDFGHRPPFLRRQTLGVDAQQAGQRGLGDLGLVGIAFGRGNQFGPDPVQGLFRQPGVGPGFQIAVGEDFQGQAIHLPAEKGEMVIAQMQADGFGFDAYAQQSLPLCQPEPRVLRCLRSSPT